MLSLMILSCLSTTDASMTCYESTCSYRCDSSTHVPLILYSQEDAPTQENADGATDEHGENAEQGGVLQGGDGEAALHWISGEGQGDEGEEQAHRGDEE